MGFAFRRTDASTPDPDTEQPNEPDGPDTETGDAEADVTTDVSLVAVTGTGPTVDTARHGLLAAVGLVLAVAVLTTRRTRRRGTVVGSVAMITVLGLFSTGAGAARFTAKSQNAGNGWTVLARPGTPTSPSATQTGAGTATFTWAAPTTGGTVANYYVYVDGVKVSTVSASTFSYAATGLSAASHTFAVSAYNTAGESAKASTTLTIVAAPGTPRTGTVTNTAAGTITVTWLAPSSGGTPTGYKVYRSTSSTVGTATLIGTTATRTYVDTGLTVGTRYYYWVTAYNAAGESAKLSAGNAKG